MRHRRVDVLVNGHLLLDGALHAHEADAELVLEQLAHRAHAAVAEVVDVVHPPDVLVQPQQILDDADEVGLRQGLLIDRNLGIELDVELEAADAREVVALGVEEHAVEQRPRRVERRRIARTHAAVDLEQGLLGVAGVVLGERVREHGAAQIPLREDDLDAGVVLALQALGDVGRHEVVGLEEDLAGLEIDDVGGEQRALEVGGLDLRRDRLALLEVGDHGLRKGDAGEDRVGLAAAARLAVAMPLPLQHGRRDGQREIGGVRHVDAHRRVELAEDRLVGLEAQGAQEDGAVELALAVDADREHFLLVVLELDPRAAVGDDLREIGARTFLGEEHAGRAVQLADDHALGAVHDEGTVIAHQRDLAEVDLFLLGVAHHSRAGLGVLVVDEQAERHLERHREGHPAFLAVGDRVVEMQIDRVAAGVALGDPVLVHEAALRAGDRLFVRMVGHDPGTAVGAGGAKELEALHLTALALPFSDRVLHEIERTGLAEVGEREDAGEHRLQALIGPLLGEQVHLQKAVVGPLLDVDQVRDRERALNPREVLARAAYGLG